MAGGLQDRAGLGRLADAPRELQRDLERAYRSAARDAASRAQDAIRGAASRHDGTLRREIAATVTVSLRRRGDGITARIASVGSKMPAGKENLAAYADGAWPHWRHPVFGDDDNWKEQNWPSARGWFNKTLRGERDRFAAAAQKALGALAAALNGR